MVNITINSVVDRIITVFSVRGGSFPQKGFGRYQINLPEAQSAARQRAGDGGGRRSASAASTAAWVPAPAPWDDMSQTVILPDFVNIMSFYNMLVCHTLFYARLRGCLSDPAIGRSPLPHPPVSVTGARRIRMPTPKSLEPFTGPEKGNPKRGSNHEMA